MDLRITHLYPDLMSIYGDRGNVRTLERRAAWRDIAVEVRSCTVGQTLEPDWADLYFFGGGQDQGQDLVGQDLAGANGGALRLAITGGAAVLAVCGGYQLLGHHYVPGTGPAIPGLGVLDVTTRVEKERFVGNLLAERDGETLVGFENHSGLTYLGASAAPLARVTRGRGNNGKDRTEGAVQGAVIGTYCHGSVLPKNPWLADLLLAWALARRHGAVELTRLDDREESAAHDAAIRAARSRR
ncbi:MAG: glutamine amidotransferase [Chloroflexi bacterium]|nr:glutamine amidotransferase [Chloroflexota bacterium]